MFPGMGRTPDPVDWSGFWPNLLAGAITGLLFAGVVAYFVGRALYRWQRDREADNRRRLAQAQWRAAGPKLAATMRYKFQRSDNPGNLPNNVAPFAAVVNTAENMNLVQWSLDDPANNDLHVAARLVENATTILRLAVELQDLIGIRLRMSGLPLPTGADIEAAAHEIFGVRVPPNISPVVPRMQKLMHEPELAAQSAAYVTWLEQCEADYNTLWAALRSHDGAPRTV